ncbi:MAG: serine protease, partial [Bacteroidota bacterium]
MNHATIEQLTEKITVKIIIPGKNHGHGTGFFITPGYIVTCAHVLRSSIEQTVLFSMPGSENVLSAKVIHSFEPRIDLAILQVNPKFMRFCTETRFCAYVGNDINSRDPCFSFGYTDPKNGNPGGDPTTLECEGWAGEQHTIIKLKGGQIRPGMSGAPLLNQRTGRICGVINKTRHRQIDLGCEALSLKVIFEEFPA